MGTELIEMQAASDLVGRMPNGRHQNFIHIEVVRTKTSYKLDHGSDTIDAPILLKKVTL